MTDGTAQDEAIAILNAFQQANEPKTGSLTTIRRVEHGVRAKWVSINGRVFTIIVGLVR